MVDALWTRPRTVLTKQTKNETITMISASQRDRVKEINERVHNLIVGHLKIESMRNHRVGSGTPLHFSLSHLQLCPFHSVWSYFSPLHINYGIGIKGRANLGGKGKGGRWADSCQWW